MSRPSVSDLVAIVGVGLIGFGAWLIFPPAGYIVVGSLLLAGAVLGARGA
ncbi:hypothetical protein SAMN02745157_1456 [Kaistia soli DSM 19436]|uniref:Uncharacterized protein n=1 Tax=Kaistia soli DSM 19436 TaxID=1122133 RepID=A0A1M4Y8X5_9HYPH|nr:hypothetical protein [Kaistia soli]SHF02100.1 hypothetical protein SAMN02745157_1456 [Kaistia soli DSM 19436]